MPRPTRCGAKPYPTCLRVATAHGIKKLLRVFYDYRIEVTRGTGLGRTRHYGLYQGCFGGLNGFAQADLEELCGRLIRLFSVNAVETPTRSETDHTSRDKPMIYEQHMLVGDWRERPQELQPGPRPITPQVDLGRARHVLSGNG